MIENSLFLPTLTANANVPTVAVQHINRPLVYCVNTDRMSSFPMFLELPQLIQYRKC